MARRPFFQRKDSPGHQVTGIEARAGFLDRPVLAVLAVSLVLIAVVFAVMLLAV